MMSWEGEKRISLIDGRLSRLNYLAACFPCLLLLDWLLNRQLHSRKMHVLVFAELIAGLIAVFCLLSCGRWRDHGSRVDTPLYVLVFCFVLYLASVVSCIFYNVALLSMMALVVVSAALPPEDAENDFGPIAVDSPFGRAVALALSAASCLLIAKVFFQSLFVKAGCS